MNIRIVYVTVLGTVLALHGYASVLGQATTASGAVFVNACAGSQAFGGLGWGGDAFHGGVTDQYVNCSFASSAVGGSAAVSASNSGAYNGHPFSNDASASAAPGVLHIGGTNSASGATTFAGAAGNVGFNDTVTITGGSGNGIWVAPFHIDGTLSSLGGGGWSQLWVTDYKNFTQLDAYGVNTASYNLFNSLNTVRNGDIFSSWDRQAIAFGAAGDSVVTLNVDRTIYFAIPITFGQSFEYGIYADFLLTQNAGGSFAQYLESADFQNTIAWQGGGYVLQGSNVISNLSYTSAAGIDYTQSLVPEPASLLLAAVGMGLVGFLRRR